MAHIALAVSDQARSRRFYETYFEFDPGRAWVAEDGVLLIEGPGEVRLALGETDEPISLPAFLHFGFRGAADADEVRAFRDRLAARRNRDRRVLGRARLRERQVQRPRRLRDRVRLGAG